MLETISSFHGGFDFRMQPFHHSIRNPRNSITDHSVPIPFYRFGDFNDGLQPTVRGPKIPSLQIMCRIGGVLQFPEPGKRQFDVIGPCRLQVQALQLLQLFCLLWCQILRVLQPQASRLLQLFVDLLLHPTHLLNRLVHLTHDVKTIKNHLSMRNVMAQTIKVGIPHITTDKRDLSRINSPVFQIFDKLSNHFFSSTFPNIKHSRRLQIAERCHIDISFTRRKLIDSQNMKPREIHSLPRPLHIMRKNPPDAIGLFTDKLSHCRHRHLPAQLQHQHLKQKSEATARTSPRHINLLNPTLSTPHPGHSSVDIGLILKKVQMPPRPVLRIVNFIVPLLTGRTGKLCSLRKVNFQIQAPGFFRKLDINHLPWLRKTQSQSKKGKFIHQDNSFKFSLHGKSYHAWML